MHQEEDLYSTIGKGFNNNNFLTNTYDNNDLTKTKNDSTDVLTNK